MSFFIVPTIRRQSKPRYCYPQPLPRPLSACREGSHRLPPESGGIKGGTSYYLSLTTLTPQGRHTQALTWQLLAQFIALWLWLTLSQVGLMKLTWGDIFSHLQSLFVASLTFLLVSLISLNLSRYGGQL